MSLPWWSKYDAQMYRALSVFPEELEGKFLGPDEFMSRFKDFYGRPAQDIVEALHHYGQKGYFKYEITLTPEYLNQGKALAGVTHALSQLQPEPNSLTDAHNGLSEPVHAKVLSEQPLTVPEVRNLPDDARYYLAFKLSGVDRTRLREDLAIYNDDAFIQPSRLVKSNESETATDSKSKAAKLPLLNLSEVSLKPESYDKYKGVLHLTPFHKRPIAGKAGVKRPKDSKKTGSKYMQCWVMERLFKSDKTLRSGVEISSLLGISKAIVDKSTTRKIENAKAEINKKVAKDSGPKNLLIIDGTKVKVDKSYL